VYRKKKVTNIKEDHGQPEMFYRKNRKYWKQENNKAEGEAKQKYTSKNKKHSNGQTGTHHHKKDKHKKKTQKTKKAKESIRYLKVSTSQNTYSDICKSMCRLTVVKDDTCGKQK